MKENKLSITIQRPIAEVFEFTIDPKNTPKWISHIESEETNEWPPKIGTIYRNRGVSDKWSKYVVTKFDTNHIFELAAAEDNYHVRYTYVAKDNRSTVMEYFEWVDHGDLELPFTPQVLNKLRIVLERAI